MSESELSAISCWLLAAFCFVVKIQLVVAPCDPENQHNQMLQAAEKQRLKANSLKSTFSLFLSPYFDQ